MNQRILIYIFFIILSGNSFAKSEGTETTSPEKRSVYFNFSGIGIALAKEEPSLTDRGTITGSFLFNGRLGLCFDRDSPRHIAKQSCIGIYALSSLQRSIRTTGIGLELLAGRMFNTGLYFGARFGVTFYSLGTDDRHSLNGGFVAGYEIPIADKISVDFESLWIIMPDIPSDHTSMLGFLCGIKLWFG